MKSRTLVILVTVIKLTTALKITIEAETSRGHWSIHNRTTASGGRAVYMNQGDALSFPFCLNQQTRVAVRTIRYSNDGGSDVVEVSLENQSLGDFKSTAAWGGGRLWDTFKAAQLIGGFISLSGGMHRLKLKVPVADEYGIEVDSIVFEVDDPYMTNASRTFTCKLPCQVDNPVLISKSVDSVDNGYIIQRSYPTKCAEEDNVIVPVFHESVRAFTVTALMPSYHTFENNRQENTMNCPFLPPHYWEFQDLHPFYLQDGETIKSNNAILNVIDGDPNAITSTLNLQVRFPLKGRSVGYIDSEIGSKLFIEFENLENVVEVDVMYKGSKDFQKLKPVLISPSKLTYSWHIPDFTWTESSDNEVILSIKSSGRLDSDLFIKKLLMERRYTGPDKKFVMFQNDEIVVEGFDVDFWWLAPNTMRVNIPSTGKVFAEVDYFRISYAVPWNDTWSEVFVMYHDGNVRLLPLVPPAADWIPFGSSLIIGQSDVNAFRPIAPISNVTIHPETLTFDVVYEDGGQINMNLSVMAEKTELKVDNISFRRDTAECPFATYRSMFVEDGNDDSDSVMTDKEGPRHVLESWEKMSGKSFLLYRRCQSDHLSVSPDIRVDINR